jgi:tetratricopeptide (TPR) repeat protein
MPGKKHKKLNDKAKADLDFEIGFFERLVERDPQYVEALQILGDAYTKCGHYDKGLRIDERLAHLCPDNALVHYNLACSLALLDRIDDAFMSLEKAIERGYGDAEWMSQDSDLEKLHGDGRFRKLLARISTRRAKHSE